MAPESVESTEILVVGAGAAGAAAALALSQRGLATTLVDVRTATARVFRAEKLEPHQLEAAARLGALPHLQRAGVSIPDVLDARDGVILARQPRPQIGLRYQGIADVLVGALPASVRRCVDRVEAVEPSDDGALVTLGEGRRIRARLVVLACGSSTRLAEALGVHHVPIEAYRSTTFGFDVIRIDGQAFPHAALTVYPHETRQRTAYLSFFPVPGATRANLFTYVEPTSTVGRAVRADPLELIRDAFPRLDRLTGPLVVSGRVSVGAIELVQAVNPARPSVVLVGDAYQTVCPSTGTGLEKAFRDAETLAEHATGWLRAGGATIARVRGFYDDEAKRRVDRGSIEAALYRRRVSLDDSWRMRLHRRRVYAAMRLHGRPAGRALEAAAGVAAWFGSAIFS